MPVPEGAAGPPAWASPGEGAWQLTWAHGLLAAADAERETAAGLAATRGRDLAAATAVQTAAEQLADKVRRLAGGRAKSGFEFPAGGRDPGFGPVGHRGLPGVRLRLGPLSDWTRGWEL